MKKIIKKENQSFVIGIDAGGTKTTAVLADRNGKIIKTASAGPASPRNDGPEKSAGNIAQAAEKVFPKEGVLAIVIGAPAIKEQRELEITLKKEILKQKVFQRISADKIFLESDQLIAFKAGTESSFGVLLIAGTGSVARAFKKGKDFHISGWGWLADEGSAVWVGEHVFQAALKDLDGRGQKTALSASILRFAGAKTPEELVSKIYFKEPINIISQFSVICDNVSKKGDRIAINILKKAAFELALVAKAAIKKVKLEKKSFPLVLVGGMFKSKVVLNEFQREIKRFAPKAGIILAKEPVLGAVKLAIGKI